MRVQDRDLVQGRASWLSTVFGVHPSSGTQGLGERKHRMSCPIKETDFACLIASMQIYALSVGKPDRRTLLLVNRKERAEAWAARRVG